MQLSLATNWPLHLEALSLSALLRKPALHRIPCSCGGDASGTELPGANTPQLITACNDTDWDRSKYGLLPNVGRGAPEIDIVEMK